MFMESIKWTPFNEIKEGQVFKYDSDYFMKTPVFYKAPYQSGLNECNCIQLSEMCKIRFLFLEDDQSVILYPNAYLKKRGGE